MTTETKTDIIQLLAQGLLRIEDELESLINYVVERDNDLEELELLDLIQKVTAKLSDKELNWLSEVLKVKNKEQQEEFDFCYAMQLALKLVMNGSYGVFGSPNFSCYSPEIANTITAQGRALIKYTLKRYEDYWYNEWHKDSELHAKMGLNTEDVQPVDKNKPISIYGDTDSVPANTKVITEQGEMDIAELYHKQLNKIEIENREVAVGETKVLNLNRDFQPYWSDNYLIFRHKTKKQLWQITTENGKQVTVTADHSLIVRREGEWLEIKPSQWLAGDEVMTVKES